MRATLRAEWTKLRTLPDFAVLLALIVALTVAVSAASAGAGGAVPDPVHAALLGVQLGQAVVAVAGVQILAGEYGCGLIHPTLLAVPRRTRMLGAKAALLTAGVAAAAVAAVLGSALAGGLLLPSLPLGGPLLRAVTGSILYLILIALLGLGTAAIVRNTVAAVGVVLGLLYVLPAILWMVPDPDWQRWIYRLNPASAAQSVQTTVGAAALPLGPWQSLAVTAGWTAAALAIGGLLLARRDAH
jgi:ABC-2 type transport system permease protein